MHVADWLTVLRGETRDRNVARRRIVADAQAHYRATVESHDDFAAVQSQITEPAFPVGTARDSFGNAVSIRLPVPSLGTNWLVQGSTGAGKTSFAMGLVAWCLAKNLPIGALDCKDGFYSAALLAAGARAATLRSSELERFVNSLCVVNPFGDYLPPLNVCRVPEGSVAEVQAYDVTLALSRLFDASLSIHMENIMRHLIVLLSEHSLSLVEAPMVLQDELLRGVLVERSVNPQMKEFFWRVFPTLPKSSALALSARIQSLTMAERVRLILGADDCISFRRVFSRGEPMFIFLGKGPGIAEEVVNVIGSLVLQLMFQGAFASEPHHRPYLLAMDEFFHLLQGPGALADRFATGITSLRSYGVHLCLLGHNWAQVPPQLREICLGNVGLCALFRTSGRNAEFFGDFLPEADSDLIKHALARGEPLPSRARTHAYLIERLQRLPARHMFWYDRSQPHRAVQVRVPDLVAPHEAVGCSEGALHRFLVESRVEQGGYALPMAVLREQLERRQQRLRAMIEPAARRPSATTSSRTARSRRAASGPRLG